MGRHRNDDGLNADADATEVMPAVGADEHRRGTFTASPLLLAAGGVALALILVVGAWALVGSGGGSEDPLVYPWSSESPGQIDVTVSMQPTDLPSGTVSTDPSALPSTTPSGSVAPSPSPSAAPPKSTALVVTQGQANRNAEGYRISYIVANTATTRVGSWRIEITFTENYKLADSWNANPSQPEPRRLVLTSQRALDPGTSIDVGLRIEKLGSNLGTPVSCTIDGRSFTCVPRWTS